MGAKRLTERTATPLAGATVDRASGVIRNVLICGFESANGRDYPVEVLRRDCAKYEGRPVNLDHAREGTVARRFGWIQDVKPGQDGKPRGDFHLLKSHPQYGAVMEAAERNPALFGFSHVAYCRTTSRDGREIVESIDKVESIDLVADPATTKSLFEGRTPMTTLKKFLEALVRHPKVGTDAAMVLKRVGEMDGMDAVPMDVPAPADDADPDDAVMSAFKTAIGSIVDQAMSGEMDPKTALGKIKELLKSHASVNADGTPDDDGDPATTDADDEPGDPKDEGKKPTDPWLILKECRSECGPEFTPGEGLLKALSALSDPADRKALLAEHRAAKSAAPEKPKSGRYTGKQVTESAVPTDPKAFAASIRD